MYSLFKSRGERKLNTFLEIEGKRERVLEFGAAHRGSGDLTVSATGSYESDFGQQSDIFRAVRFREQFNGSRLKTRTSVCPLNKPSFKTLIFHLKSRPSKFRHLSPSNRWNFSAARFGN